MSAQALPRKGRGGQGEVHLHVGNSDPQMSPVSATPPESVLGSNSAEVMDRLVELSRTSSPISSSPPWAWFCWQTWVKSASSSSLWPARDRGRQVEMHGMLPRQRKVAKISERALLAPIRKLLSCPYGRKRSVTITLQRPMGIRSGVRRFWLPRAMLEACRSISTLALTRFRGRGTRDEGKLTPLMNCSTGLHDIAYSVRPCPLWRVHGPLTIRHRVIPQEPSSRILPVTVQVSAYYS